MFWCSTFFTFSFVESWDLLTYCKAIEILDEVTGATAELNVKCRITLKKCCFVGRELEEIFIFVIGQSVKKTFSKIFPKLNLQMTVSFHLHLLILMTNIDNMRPAVEILPVIRWTLKRILKIFHMIWLSLTLDYWYALWRCHMSGLLESGAGWVWSQDSGDVSLSWCMIHVLWPARE